MVIYIYKQQLKKYQIQMDVDWWGYNTKNYANKQGKQMQTVYNMIQYILGRTKRLSLLVEVYIIVVIFTYSNTIFVILAQ